MCSITTTSRVQKGGPPVRATAKVLVHDIYQYLPSCSKTKAAYVANPAAEDLPEEKLMDKDAKLDVGCKVHLSDQKFTLAERKLVWVVKEVEVKKVQDGVKKDGRRSV